jgi:hypothetical protein
MGKAHTSGGPAEADHRRWEPLRVSPLPLQGTTSRRPVHGNLPGPSRTESREDAKGGLTTKSFGSIITHLYLESKLTFKLT